MGCVLFRGKVGRITQNVIEYHTSGPTDRSLRKWLPRAPGATHRSRNASRVCQLSGRRGRKGLHRGPRDPAFFAEAASIAKERGYTALKFDPFGSAYRFMDAQDEKFSMSLIRAVRDAVGPDVDLLIEGHDRFSVSTAIRIGRRFQFPSPPANASSVSPKYSTLASSILCNQRPSMLAEFQGPRRWLRSPESAEAFVALHQAQSPLNTAINAHIHAAILNFLTCFDFNAPWAFEIMLGVPRAIDGYLEPSDAPGIGVELNEVEMAKYPFGQDNFLRLFEDGWELRRPKRAWLIGKRGARAAFAALIRVMPFCGA